jgi:hypothetical protein
MSTFLNGGSGKASVPADMAVSAGILLSGHDSTGSSMPASYRNRATKTPWEIAIEIFNRSMTKDERKIISLDTCPQASREAFVEEVLAAKNEAVRKRSKLLDRIDAIVERVTFYSKPMDVLSQASKEMMFAWGSLKFLMQVVMSEKQTSDKLSRAIAAVVQLFGRCELYYELFPGRQALVAAIGILTNTTFVFARDRL